MQYKKIVCLVFLFGSISLSGMKEQENTLLIPDPSQHAIQGRKYKQLRVNVIRRQPNIITCSHHNYPNPIVLYKMQPPYEEEPFFEIWVSKRKKDGSYFFYGITGVKQNEINFRNFYPEKLKTIQGCQYYILSKAYEELGKIFTENNQIIKKQVNH